MAPHGQPGSAVDTVRGFIGRRVLVVGDAVLDTYVHGSATRLSREAPVPVIAPRVEHDAPGGAANVAANLAALGADVRFVGLVGEDATAALLRTALRETGVRDDWLVADAGATSLIKRRIVADGQCLVRLDEGSLSACTDGGREALLDLLERLYPEVELVVISDYACGTIDDRALGRLRQLQADHGPVLAIDAKAPLRFSGFGATVMTPNLDEAQAAAGSLGQMPSTDPGFIAARLRRALDARHIAITLASGGVLLVGPPGRQHHLPAVPIANASDVGAGDSFTAAMALALAGGADARLAARIGIEAAAIACTRQQTAVVSHRELLRRVGLATQPATPPSHSIRQVAILVDAARHAGKRVVFTNGVFDILHAGHVELLRRAKALGDVLVVGINSDASVRRLKGEQRPINREEDRLMVVAAIDAVDYALIFGEDSPAEVIRALRPDIHVKGGDYTAESLPEIDAVREVGARVEILPLVSGLSTTNVIHRIVSRASGPLVEQPL